MKPFTDPCIPLADPHGPLHTFPDRCGFLHTTLGLSILLQMTQTLVDLCILLTDLSNLCVFLWTIAFDSQTFVESPDARSSDFLRQVF